MAENVHDWTLILQSVQYMSVQAGLPALLFAVMNNRSGNESFLNCTNVYRNLLKELSRETEFKCLVLATE
jgi:hypothetical protein